MICKSHTKTKLNSIRLCIYQYFLELLRCSLSLARFLLADLLLGLVPFELLYRACCLKSTSILDIAPHLQSLHLNKFRVS